MRKKIFVYFAVCSLVLTGCSINDAIKTGEVYIDPPPPLPQESVKQEDLNKVAKQITYYEQNQDVKVVKPENATAAEKIVKREIKKSKSKLKVNPENETYRDFVSSILASSGHLTNAERKTLLDYWKYLGSIQSKQANEKIKKLLKKLKSGRGTQADLDELKGLQPIDPGVQLRDRGRVQQDPSENQEMDKPNKKQPDHKKDGQSEEQDQKQPASGKQDPTGDPKQPSNEETNQPSNNEQPGSVESEQAGNREQPSSEDKEPNDQPSSKDGKSNQEQPNNRETGQSSDNEQADKEKDNSSKNRLLDHQAKTQAKNLNKPEKNGYNRYKAQQYAYEWWNKRNNEEFGYYSRISGGCYDCWYDCTSFISQVIYKGGIKFRTKGEIPWYYSDDGPSHSWAVANSKYKHFKNRTKMVDNVWKLKIGDVISFDWDSNNHIDHTAVVTKIDQLGVYVTQHTYDRKDAPVMHWLAPFQGVKMYAFDMGSTKNE